MFLVGVVTALHYMFMVPLMLLSVFLILVILVQRGRGGGLTGALGGMGGQSAFGTKAGDLFTRITIVIAAIWVLLSMGALKVLNNQAFSAGYNRGDVGRPASTSKDGAGKGGIDKAGSPEATPPAEETTTEKSAPTDGAAPSGGAAPPLSSGAADQPPAGATPPTKNE